MHLCSITFKASYFIFGSLCQLYIQSPLKFFKKKNLLIPLSHVEFGIAYDSFTAISFSELTMPSFVCILQSYWDTIMVIANILFQQHNRRFYTWTSPDGQHQNQTDYILCSQRWRNAMPSAKTRPGTNCGSDHELLNAKFRLKLKKVGKTTRRLRYDLNQMLYNYTVKVKNRFKRLHLIDKSAWRTMDRGSWHGIGDRDQDHP